jgi:hypothetical protein
LKPKCLLSSENDKNETANITDSYDSKESSNESNTDLENDENPQDPPNNQDCVLYSEYLAYEGKEDKKYNKNLAISLQWARRIVRLIVNQ